MELISKLINMVDIYKQFADALLTIIYNKLKKWLINNTRIVFENKIIYS